MGFARQALPYTGLNFTFITNNLLLNTYIQLLRCQICANHYPITWSHEVRMYPNPQTISGPSKSKLRFTPICSTRLRQLLPR
jgi:hypothetical protein